MSRMARRFALVVHIASAGGWFGVDVAMAVVIATAAFTPDLATRAACLQVLELITVWPLLGCGLVCLLSGLVLGWGSTWGPISEAVRRVRAADRPVAHAHLVHINPFAPNLGEVLAAYPKVLVPEMNMGQLSRLVRAEFLTPTTSLNKVQGLPFSATEIENKILEMLDA